MNIFVAKISFNTNDLQLRTAFEKFGTVSKAQVITDKMTGKSKGYGFVEMPNDDDARKAIEQLNDSELDGRTIVVKKAEPKKEGGGGRSGGGGGYRRSSW
jgi:RNA recognition motif-containing protein